MNFKATNVADAELNLLELLWTSQEPRTARQLAREAYHEVNPSTMATVQKLLARLETKGLIRRDRQEYAHSFSAMVDRETFLGQQLESMAHKLTGGSVLPVLLHFIRSAKLSKQDRDELRRILKDERPRKSR